MKPIEEHPDFTLSPQAIEHIDPEIREDQGLNAHKIKELNKEAKYPLRDFVWRTSEGATRISEMDPEFLLVVARHCVHRADMYHEKVAFFINVFEIVWEHANAQGIELPDTVDEIQDMLEQIQESPTPEPQKAPERSYDSDILLDDPDPSVIEAIKAQAMQKEDA